MPEHPFLYVGDGIGSELIRVCHQQGFTRFLLVADGNTYAALGKAAESVLQSQGWEVSSVVLVGPEVRADADHIFDVLLRSDPMPHAYVAVGSGTLTDISRFCSHRLGLPFLSLPTAASVDGFTSIGAPLVIRDFKRTISCQGPMAIFADLGVLSAAPQRLTAAGVGDLLGKFTAVADWRLGHILRGERYNEAIAQRSLRAVQSLIPRIAQVGHGDREGVRRLFEGLVETGLCMLDFGGSAPASGAEHHMAHFWEMRLLWQHRPAQLHGAGVGYGCYLSAQWYDALRAMSRDEAAAHLERARRWERGWQEEEMRQVFGSVVDEVIHEQASFLSYTARSWGRLKQHILDNWDELQAVAAQVPSSAQLREWLQIAGASVSPQELGLTTEDVTLARQYAHYLRNRFTIAKLRLLLGIE